MAGQRAPGWCSQGALKNNEWCPWKSTQLKQMMEQQEHGFLNTDCAQNNGCRYNELVLNSSTWVTRLPKTVEAFFIVRGSRDDSAPAITAREAHVKFLTMYNLSATDVPMLELDLLAASEGVSAINIFREVENPMLRSSSRRAKLTSRWW